MPSFCVIQTVEPDKKEVLDIWQRFEKHPPALEDSVDDGNSYGYGHHQHLQRRVDEQPWTATLPQTRQCITGAVADDFCCIHRLRQPSGFLSLTLPLRQPVP